MAENEIDKLHHDLESYSTAPLWRVESDVVPPVPKSKAVPWLWKWPVLYDLAKRAGRLITIERGGDRRVIGFANPGLVGQPYTTHTMWGGLQWLNGREIAPAHRHTAQAIRFIIEGSGAYSTVQGDKVYLERGDFAINPPWYWHDHGSDVDTPMLWMDGLDLPLNNYLEASFFEPYGMESQPNPVLDSSTLKYGVGQLRPAWEQPTKKYSPISTYKWADSEKALMNLAKVAASPFDDIALEYTNPHNGKPVMDTMTGWIQMIRPGIHTKAHRQVNSAIYHVFEGSGAAIIDGVRFDFEQGDFFVIPTWACHEFLNESKSDRLVMFSLQDTPVLVALGKYREEPLTTNGGHQAVRGKFDPEKALALA